MDSNPGGPSTGTPSGADGGDSAADGSASAVENGDDDGDSVDGQGRTANGVDTPDARAARPLFVLALVVSIIVLAGALLTYLLFLGDRGNTIAGPAQLFVGIVTLVLMIVTFLLERGKLVWPAWPSWARRMAKWFGYLVVVASLVASIGLFSQAWTDRQIAVTEQVSLSGQFDMADGSSARMTVPDPKRRTGVALRPVITSRNDIVGNCVGSSRIFASVQVDGVPRPGQKAVRSGQEVRLDIGGVQDSATVVLTLRVPRDPTCRLDLTVVEALLYTSEGTTE